MSALVVDSSVIVAALVGTDTDAEWAMHTMAGSRLLAPHLLPFEVANVLRRHEAAGIIDPTQASVAHAHLVALRVRLVAHREVAERVWELRRNLTAYDAALVAVAERAQCPLATLDVRLAQATGPQCPVLAP